jgi:hypothetical protein
MTKTNVKMTIVFVTTLLFFLLSPGVLVTLPPTHNADGTADKDKCGILLQLAHGKGGCATNWAAVILHTLLFGLIMFVIVESLLGRMRNNLLGRFRL